MKKLSEFLYGKESSDKMDLFTRRIKELDDKYKSELNDESVESKILVNYSAGKNLNSLHFTDNKLDVKIIDDVKSIFNEIFS